MKNIDFVLLSWLITEPIVFWLRWNGTGLVFSIVLILNVILGMLLWIRNWGE